MNRREVTKLIAFLPIALPALSWAAAPQKSFKPAIKKIPYQKGSKIPVAFIVSQGAEVVDFAGPWGVFEYVFVHGMESSPFELYTVAETTSTLKVSGGLKITPDYTYENAPPPKIVVIPAMEESNSKPMIEWIKKVSAHTDMIMSVCNGVFVLAQTGLLDGKKATSHHGAYALFAADYPKIQVMRGVRFVDSGNVATAGGLTSGIDLALHIVARYFGIEVAENAALALEYQGQGWKKPESNSAYAKKPILTKERPLCPICEMRVNPKTAVSATYRHKKHYFCSDWCKTRFLQSPERF